MYELVILAAALLRDHPADFKAGWHRAKVRAVAKMHWRQGLITHSALMNVELRNLSPSEEKKVMDYFKRRFEEDEARQKRIEPELKAWRAKHGYPHPPVDQPLPLLDELKARVRVAQMERERLRVMGEMEEAMRQSQWHKWQRGRHGQAFTGPPSPPSPDVK